MRLSSLTRSSIPLLAALALAVPAAAGAQGIERPRVPLRTALNELTAFRTEYQEAYNKHDMAAVAGMYAPDATLITAAGEQLIGRSAIRAALARDTSGVMMKLTSDTMRVVGHTAWDVGTVTAGPAVQHYLVVLRRGIKDWQIAGVAVVPEAAAMGSR
jgi:ketosteroid isomerase-like protein